MASASEDESPDKLKSKQAELEEKEREALLAIKEDLAKWLSALLDEPITAHTFMEDLKSAVSLCKLAKLIQAAAAKKQPATGEPRRHPRVPLTEIRCDFSVASTFQKFRSMSNAANFISWCKNVEGVHIIFESEGLVSEKDERSVILCLLDLARVAEKLGMDSPELVKMEREIDLMETAEDEEEKENTGKRQRRETSPPKAKKTKRDALDEKILQLFDKCTCQRKLQTVCYGGGKFQIIAGERKTTIFVKVLSDRVLVRVGGGWDTLDHFLLKHDPCRYGLSVKASLLKQPNKHNILQLKYQEKQARKQKLAAASTSRQRSKSRSHQSVSGKKTHHAGAIVTSICSAEIKITSQTAQK